MKDIKTGALVVDSSHGVYCPQVFSQVINHDFFPDIKDEYWKILDSGPDNELYWDTWCYHFECQVATDGSMIYQDGDIWLVYEWSEDDEDND